MNSITAYCFIEFFGNACSSFSAIATKNLDIVKSKALKKRLFAGSDFR